MAHGKNNQQNCDKGRDKSVVLLSISVIACLASLTCPVTVLTLEDLKPASGTAKKELMQFQPESEPLPVFDPTNFTLSKASFHRRLAPKKGGWKSEVDFSDGDLELIFLPKIVEVEYAQHERNVKTDSDGVTILLPGQYLVYSSIHYIPDEALMCEDFGEQTWYQHIKRTRPGNSTTETLLTSAYTCGNGAYFIHETSYMSGVFDLQANDRIRIYVSGMGLVSYQVQSTFMGVVMLGEHESLN